MYIHVTKICNIIIENKNERHKSSHPFLYSLYFIIAIINFVYFSVLLIDIKLAFPLRYMPYFSV